MCRELLFRFEQLVIENNTLRALRESCEMTIERQAIEIVRLSEDVSRDELDRLRNENHALTQKVRLLTEEKFSWITEKYSKDPVNFVRAMGYFLGNDKKIQIIKHVRNAFEIGLKDSKDIVEYVITYDSPQSLDQKSNALQALQMLKNRFAHDPLIAK